MQDSSAVPLDGADESRGDRWREYSHLATLERESTQMRYTTFTAFLSISFLIAGLGAQQGSNGEEVRLPLFGDRPLGALAFVLGFVFFCFSWFFYWWYHRYSHMYRGRLKQIETELGIEVYRLRKRKQLGKMKFHFDWGLRILGVWYFVIAGSYAGYLLISFVLAASLGLYGVFLLRSRSWKVEPHESESAET